MTTTLVLFIYFFFPVIKFAIGMFTYVAHFDRKVGIFLQSCFSSHIAKSRTRSKQGRTVFSGIARAIAYGPDTGIFSVVLQGKRARGRTGHMIN